MADLSIPDEWRMPPLKLEEAADEQAEIERLSQRIKEL